MCIILNNTKQTTNTRKHIHTQQNRTFECISLSSFTILLSNNLASILTKQTNMNKKPTKKKQRSVNTQNNKYTLFQDSLVCKCRPLKRTHTNTVYVISIYRKKYINTKIYIILSYLLGPLMPTYNGSEPAS